MTSTKNRDSTNILYRTYQLRTQATEATQLVNHVTSCSCTRVQVMSTNLHDADVCLTLHETHGHAIVNINTHDKILNALLKCTHLKEAKPVTIGGHY